LNRVGWNATSELHLHRRSPFQVWRSAAGGTRAAREVSGDGYLGVTGAHLSWEQNGHKLVGFHGAQVVVLVPGSPAEGAGLRIGDVIERVGEGYVDAENFDKTIAALSPGERVTLTVRRYDGNGVRREEKVEVTVGRRRAAAATRP
jgi:S1-C subfamily serine protease